MGQPVVHWELWSKNPEKISDFYQRVFEWKIQHLPELNYRMVDTGGGGINRGIMQPQSGPWPGNMAFYIAVDDLSRYGKRLTDGGGKVIVEKQEVPGMGRFSLFQDPDGRVLGIWEQGG
jgi:uncharacterized protein